MGPGEARSSSAGRAGPGSGNPTVPSHHPTPPPRALLTCHAHASQRVPSAPPSGEGRMRDPGLLPFSGAARPKGSVPGQHDNCQMTSAGPAPPHSGKSPFASSDF